MGCGAIAEDASPAARSAASVEELAIPNDEKKAELQRRNRATPTRGGICLMIESAAKSQDLPLNFSRADLAGKPVHPTPWPMTRRGATHPPQSPQPMATRPERV